MARPKTQGGSDRQFAKWDLNHNGDVRTFEIRYHNPENIGADEAGRAYFYCQTDDPIIRAKSSDLEKLRQEILRQWEEHFAIEWTPMLVVRVEQKAGESDHTLGFGTMHSLVLRVGEYMEGIRKDGRVFHYSTNEKRQGVTGRISSGSLRERGEGPDRAVLADTPANRAGLRKMQELLEAVGGWIGAMVGGGRFEEALAEMASLPPARFPTLGADNVKETVEDGRGEGGDPATVP
jgi:hypothetical protein